MIVKSEGSKFDDIDHKKYAHWLEHRWPDLTPKYKALKAEKQEQFTALCNASGKTWIKILNRIRNENI